MDKSDHRQSWRQKLAKFLVGVICFSVAMIGLNALSLRIFKIGLFSQPQTAQAQSSQPVPIVKSVACDTKEEPVFMWDDRDQGLGANGIDREKNAFYRWVNTNTNHWQKVKIVNIQNQQPIKGLKVKVKGYENRLPAYPDLAEWVDNPIGFQPCFDNVGSELKTDDNGEVAFNIRSTPTLSGIQLLAEGPGISYVTWFAGCEYQAKSPFFLPRMRSPTYSLNISDCPPVKSYYPPSPSYPLPNLKGQPTYSMTNGDDILELNNQLDRERVQLDGEGRRCRQYVNSYQIVDSPPLGATKQNWSKYTGWIESYSQKCAIDNKHRPWEKPQIFPVAPKNLTTLTITKTGPGKVTSSPAGIDCGATCSAQFEQGKT